MGTYVAFLLTGLEAGFASVLLGIGGGLIMVPMFLLLFHLQARVGMATSLVYIAPLALAGALLVVRHSVAPQWRLAALAPPD